MFAASTGTSEIIAFVVGPVGLKWCENYHATGHYWNVKAIIAIELVTVPAGTCPLAYVYRDYADYDNPNTPDGNLTGDVWYECVVPGVGLVKEVN